MNTQRKRFFVAGGIAVFSLMVGNTAWSTDSPLQVVRMTTEQALSVLQDPAYQEEQHQEKRMEKMWEIIVPRFDAQEIAQRSLGVQGRQLTDGQKKNFQQLFLQLVKQNYSDTLKRYTADAQFSFDGEQVEGDSAEVQTHIKTPSQDQPFSVMYRLHRKNGEWLVYDVVAENISMVRNYRTQFSRIMTDSSYEDLERAIKEKLMENGTASAASAS